MHAAPKRMADFVKDRYWLIEVLGIRWASSIDLIFEGAGVLVGVEKPNSISLLSGLRKDIGQENDEIRLRMENEIEDTEFRLKRGADLGRFDQFWDGSMLFKCRYSRSKWLYFVEDLSTVPFEIYLHALKGNKNIINITFSHFVPDSDIDQFLDKIYDFPWMTSISWDSFGLPAIHRDPLFIQSTNNDLITFAKEIRPKLNFFSTYIFTDAEGYDMRFTEQLGNNARVLISFVAPTSGKSLILRLKHSGEEDGPLEITLGSNIIQLGLKPSSMSESSLTIDDITLYPIQFPRLSNSDQLSFEPEIRNEIVIEFRRKVERRGHFLHDIEFLDEAGREYSSHSASFIHNTV